MWHHILSWHTCITYTTHMLHIYHTHMHHICHSTHVSHIQHTRITYTTTRTHSSHITHMHKIIFRAQAKEEKKKKALKGQRVKDPCPALAVSSFPGLGHWMTLDHVTSLSIITSQHPLHPPEGRAGHMARGKQEPQPKIKQGRSLSAPARQLPGPGLRKLCLPRAPPVESPPSPG